MRDEEKDVSNERERVYMLEKCSLSSHVEMCEMEEQESFAWRMAWF